jgi:hypothetical protein
LAVENRSNGATAETTITAVKPEKIAIQFQLDEKLIDGATIRPFEFRRLRFRRPPDAQPAAFAARLLRARMSKQVVYGMKGMAISLTPEEVLR